MFFLGWSWHVIWCEKFRGGRGWTLQRGHFARLHHQDHEGEQYFEKKSWKKCSNFLDFRFIVKRRGVENAWSPNWFFHVGLKWVYLLERTFYILSRRFLRADNPVWPEENFYYRAGNIFGFFLPVVQFNYWIFFYSEDLKKLSKPNWNSNMIHFVGIFYHTCVSR